MTVQKRLDQHHVESLDRLAEGRMEKLLGGLFPRPTRHGEIELGGVRWLDPVWMSASNEPRWVRTLEIEVALEYGWDTVKLDIPWTLDQALDDAEPPEDPPEESPTDPPTESPEESPTDPPEESPADPPADPLESIRLGGQASTLIDGCPLVPLSQRTFRAGLHILRNDSRAGGRRLVLVPDAGPSFLINPARMTSKHRYRAIISGSASIDFNSDKMEPLQEWPPFDRFIGRGGPAIAYFEPATVERVRARIGDTALAEWTPDHFWRLLVEEHESKAPLPDFRDELSDRVLATRHYGDLVARAVMESVLAGARQLHELDPEAPGHRRLEIGPRELAKLIESQFARRYRRMRRGGGGLPQLLVPDDDRSTLANLERRRTVTRYSREIPDNIRYWLWTRDIHPDDRGRLCPLQTPESSDIGYVRFVALGDGSTAPIAARDLSAAASLVPFLNHNDPARSSIGSKNLKQALPIEGRHPPRVRSGTESLIAEAHGVARVPEDVDEAVVEEIQPDRVVARCAESDERIVVPFGPPGPTGFTADGRWTVTVSAGDRIRPGRVVAHAPDVVLEGDAATLALGADVLVAYTPWHGMNHEDAIVVSEAIVDRFASTHVLLIREQLSPVSEIGFTFLNDDTEVEAGDQLAVVQSAVHAGPLRTVAAPEAGMVESIDIDDEVVAVQLRTRRPLAVGDKLTSRHGGKGVVSQILPESEMPSLPDGRRVEMLLNPLGVIRRLNIGQLLEAHVSLLDDLTGAGPREVGRRLDPQQRQELAEDLGRAGAPLGRLTLTCADGETPLDRDGGVVVGWQHMVKLDHLAADKRRERLHSSSSLRDQQPAKGSSYRGGHRRGGAQRMGEMEIWALLASGADAFLDEALTVRSGSRPGASPSLASVKAHLAVGQVGADRDGTVKLLDSRDTEPLPKEMINLVKSSRTFGGGPDGDSDALHDALYAEIHGGHDIVTCSCGDETGSRRRCARCHTIARPRESPGRSEVRFHLPLDVPVRHPWFTFSPKYRRDAASDPFPEELAADRLVSREQAIAAALQSGFEATLGLELEDGSRVALNDEAAWISAEGGATTFDIAGPALDGALDMAVDHLSQRAFVLLPARWAGQVAELDLTTGELVRHWTTGWGWEAHRARLITLNERGWPVLWGGHIGRCDCVPMLDVLPILPPAYRVFRLDALDHRYGQLIFATNGSVPRGRRDSRSLAEKVRKVLGGPRDDPDAQTISGRLNNKTGLIRRGLRGRQNNAVARDVIVPDTGLGLEEVGLPGRTMEELGLKEGDTVVVNRQPTLRPSNIVAMRTRRHSGDYIALHPMMSKQLAGDFDGDEVTVHRPISRSAAEDAWRRLRPTTALCSDADGAAIMGPDLDVALGLYLLSLTEKGRDDLKDLFDADIQEVVTGDRANKLVKDWYGRMVHDGGADPPAQIAELFALATTASTGWSASLLELESLAEDELDRVLSDGMPGSERTAGWLAQALQAGVAGGSGGVRQLLTRRGQLRTFTGDHHTNIESCFLNGLSDEEVFETAAGALATLADKKLVTPRAGHVTKRLADAMHDVVVTAEDCGAGGDRTPLGCKEAEGCCAACIGELASGRKPELGERIGLRAAMLIGERCTQKAMKTFQAGGTNTAVAGAVECLEAAFGARRRHPVEGRISFADANEQGRMRDLARQTYEELDEAVDEKLLCLVLRRLMSFEKHPRPLEAARFTGDALVDASTLGRLAVVLDAVGRPGSGADSSRRNHVYGAEA